MHRDSWMIAFVSSAYKRQKGYVGAYCRVRKVEAKLTAPLSIRTHVIYLRLRSFEGLASAISCAR